MNSYHILVIEDDELMQKVMHFILSKEGYTVTVKSNGKEGLEALQDVENKFDLIITDLMMPHANGFEILNVARQTGNGGIPVIIVSNLSNEQMILDGFTMGASDYVKKPIMAGELVLRVKRLLNSPKLV
ncbi:response regulator transcription factor [Olivibacter domesticus]|uniref:Response regulator receiver domain-containing protein n=1 Tax=Olivibacter domesticus TaxID=407022 RepID=A0A1H7KX41_OLID1|nr:response regulator transcription factor [Olivibacter domesticus]SEK91100.1 Response regulator receiver domain-containing protein [Olivibacter domesticus]